jgi:hypothetical protein
VGEPREVADDWSVLVMSEDRRERMVLVGTVERGARDEIRVSVADFERRTYVHLEVFAHGPDGPAFKRGMTFTPPIWRKLLVQLTTAVNLAENRHPVEDADEFAEAMREVRGWRRP